MTTSTKAKLYAVLTGVLGIISALASMPPSDQTAFLAALIAVFPPAWRGEITAIVHLLMVASGYLTAHYAAKSGPQPMQMTLEQTAHDPALPTPIGEPPLDGVRVEKALPAIESKPPMA